MNSLTADPYPKTKHCIDVSHTTEVMAIFEIFAYFDHRVVAMATSLRLLQSGTSFFALADHENPRSNHILVVSRRNAFVAILVPKLVALVTPLRPLCIRECHRCIR